jgi:hypothetical protein
VEDNNTFTRTVIILPPLPDTIPPVVQSFRMNNGEPRTSHRQVYLNATAQDDPGGTGVASLLYTEYIYVPSRGDWVPVSSSDWQPYAEASVDYPWQLNPVPGVHYMRTWAADVAGNLSFYWRSDFINLVPTTVPANIATAQVHTYRFQLQAGEGLSLTLASVTGDADVYIFGPDDSLITYSFSEDPVEGAVFTAEESGIHQIEVYGFLAGSYTLQIGPYSGGLLQAPSQVMRLQSKTPRTQPLVNSTDSPDADGEAVEVPSAPSTIKYEIYLPLVLRQ